MASPQPSQKPDLGGLPVTLKVNFEGATRRHKLSLRDVGVSSLEVKVREFLKVSPDVELLLERYSDSAGAYIVLDAKNIPVYKQLYRAAKAKQKLKLRVTKKNEYLSEKSSPRPVTVEDVPEAFTAPAASATVEQTSDAPKETPRENMFDLLRGAVPKAESSNASTSQLPTSDTGIDFETSLLSSLMKKQGSLAESVEEETRPRSFRCVPVVRGSEARDNWFARAHGHTANPACPPRAPSGFNFAVCCNSCDKTIPDSHYHCSTCEDGDFDLCQSCVDQGISCHGESHWLIKRVVKDGQIVTSTTETIAPKPKKKEEPPVVQEDAPKLEFGLFEPYKFTDSFNERFPPISDNTNYNVRTCNCCINDLPEDSFLHCQTCEDFDLCQTCFSKDNHGHNPKHAFAPVGPDSSYVPNHIKVRLAPGRNQMHSAICDGCDVFISGVRHKCLDCPDWDYCGDCIPNAKWVHPNHRFVPVYEPLSEVRSRLASRQTHYGICCDGPLCSIGAKGSPGYIHGIRYKCAICNDTDFCANCEASPANNHNKTHPLIKFRTPVRQCTVTTTTERDGLTMPHMGDRVPDSPVSRAADSTSIASVQTVVDVKPVEPVVVKEEVVEQLPTPEPSVEVEPAPAPVVEKVPTEKDLVAVFVSDTITDGTTLPANNTFQQTWVLRNDGDVAWPAGCSVKFVGGDYMGHVDSNQPAGISELVSASESTICYEPLAPGQEFPFTVLLRTPSREGRLISYWRLTGKDGMKFGHRLWCDVIVKAPKVEEKAPQQVVVAEQLPKAAVPAASVTQSSEETQTQSQMIFPKLEKESPMSSVHQDAKSETTSAEAEEADDFEDCGAPDEWDEESDDGFMTDEEYDILDASDEEYLEAQEKKVRK